MVRCSIVSEEKNRSTSDFPLYILALHWMRFLFIPPINGLISLRIIQALRPVDRCVSRFDYIGEGPVSGWGITPKYSHYLFTNCWAHRPLIAVATAGGYIISSYGLRITVFIVLTLILCVDFSPAAFLWLPAGNAPDTRTFPKACLPITKVFFPYFTNTQFYTYCLTGALAFAGLFAYVAGSPVVFIDVFCTRYLKKPAAGFSHSLSIGFIGSSQLNELICC